jgi:hypothetical protein
MELIELKTVEEREEAFTILVELIPQLKRKPFLDSFDHELMKSHKLFGLRKEGRLVSVAAAWVLMTGLPEKLLWIYALVTTEPMRNSGCGRTMLNALKQYASNEGFDEIRTHSHRERAAEFWVNKAKLDPFSIVYRKKINQ